MATNAELAKTREQLAVTSTELEKLGADASRTRTNLAATNAELAQVREQLVATATELEKVDADASRTRTNLDATNAELGQAREQLVATAAELREVKKTSQEKIARLVGDLVSLDVSSLCAGSA